MVSQPTPFESQNVVNRITAAQLPEATWSPSRVTHILILIP